ncbi:putative glycyl-tRNA synthetase, alpha subunit [Anaplasma phagocytophilum str. Annie]|nr:putative glycyl-tRNA synthetase, alpha subunit [Anaplasma phagocytophilum str. Annie]
MVMGGKFLVMVWKYSIHLYAAVGGIECSVIPGEIAYGP